MYVRACVYMCVLQYVCNLPGQPQTINVSVQPANNFPVDVYYLMDQSFSMNDDLENLRNLAEQLG